MAINDAVDWSTDLGGGVARRPDPGGHVPVRRGDAVRARAVGPVGRPRRRRDRRQAAPPPGPQLPPDRDDSRVACSSRPGIGDRVDDKTRAMRGYEGPWIVPALETAGFAPETRQRRGDEPPPLRPRRRAAPGGWLARRSRTRRSSPSRPSGRSPSATTRGSSRRTSSPSSARRDLGQAGLGRRASTRSCPACPSCPTGGHSTGHQAVIVRGAGEGARTLAFFGDLLMRPWAANPRWVTVVRRLPARLGHPQGRAVRAGRRGGLDRGAVARGAPPDRTAGARPRPVRVRGSLGHPKVRVAPPGYGRGVIPGPRRRGPSSDTPSLAR